MWQKVIGVLVILGLGWSGLPANKNLRLYKTNDKGHIKAVKSREHKPPKLYRVIPNISHRTGILSTGGPDGYGYAWIDSNEPGWTPPAYQDPPVFTTSLHDDGSVQINLPFTFTFYGTDYSSIYICSNGFGIFGTWYNDFSNTSIPNTSTPNNGLYAYWDDLVPPAGGHVDTMTYGTAPNRVFVVEWDSIPHWGSPNAIGAYTFEIQLYEGGDSMAFLYNSVSGYDPSYDNGASATIGIENVDGTDGLQYSYNTASVNDGDAILFYKVPPPANDVGVASFDTIIDAPVVQGDPDDFKVWVKNFGTNDQSNFNVEMWVTGDGVVGSQTVPNLAAGDSTLVTFNWAPTSSGNKLFMFYTTLAGDGNNSNDTLRLSGVVFGSATGNIYEDFETTLDVFPGWSIIDNNGDGLTWHQTNTNAHGGLYSVRTPVTPGTDRYPDYSSDFLVSPLLDFGSNPYGQIGYWHIDSLEPNYDYVYVYTGSYTSYDDPGGGIASFLSSHTGVLPQGDWVIDVFNWGPVTGRYNYVFWDFESDWSVYYPGFWMDDLAFNSRPTAVGESSINQPVTLAMDLLPITFRKDLTVFYNVPGESNVRIDIFDSSGRLVNTLVNAKLKRGAYSLKWNASGYPGNVYFIRLSSGTRSVVRKAIHIR